MFPLLIGLILWLALPAHAYIDAVGGGLIFQIGYILFTGAMIMIAVPFKKITGYFKRKQIDKDHPPE